MYHQVSLASLPNSLLMLAAQPFVISLREVNNCLATTEHNRVSAVSLPKTTFNITQSFLLRWMDVLAVCQACATRLAVKLTAPFTASRVVSEC